MEREQALKQLASAIERDDKDAAKDAALALATIVLRDLGRIADALEHIGRNLTPRT